VQEKDLTTFELPGSVLDHLTLARLARSFYLATGLGVNIVNPAGELLPMVDTGMHPFCKMIQGTAVGRRRCAASLTRGGELAAQLGEPYIFRCHAGIIEWSAPVVVQGEFLGSFSCGPALMWPMDDLAWEELIEAVGDLDLPLDGLREMLTDIKVLTAPNVQSAAELLFVVANHIAKSGMETLMQRRELNEQQALLAEAISARKRAADVLRSVEAGAGAIYPVAMERTLLNLVRTGDRTGARKILNDLLGEIFLGSSGEFEIMKARLLELLIVLSRAAVEGGASLERLFGLNYEYITSLSQIERFEDLCMWIVGALNTFMDTVYQVRHVRNAKSIGGATTYIRYHYNEDLTLENVAQKVYISPFYLSHLFREELGLTYVEYLTRIRVGEAKKILLNSDLTVLGVAEKVGYGDASHFCKVFRRATGLSPSQFRKSGG